MAKTKNKSTKGKNIKPIKSTKKQTSFALKGIVGLVLLLLVGYGIYTFSFKEKTLTSNEKIPENFTAQFSLLPASYTGIDFENYIQEGAERGLQFYDYFYNGSGVAVGDINNDGLPDIFFTGNDAANRLYINEGNFKFKDISKSAGIQSGRWGTGVTMVDINKDGFLDIYVCNSGPYYKAQYTLNELYINDGKNHFTEEAAKYGIADGSRSTQASFFDMDNDGDLDLWVMNHALRSRGAGSVEWFARLETLDQSELKRECSTLFRNEGNGQFTDISRVSGIEKVGFGLGIAVHDFDDNGFLDVYIANDYFIPDFMFFNNGDGTFTDKSKTKLGHTPYYAMGCDAADINNDGLTDLMVVDMTPSDHERNKVLMASMNVAGFDYLTKTKDYTPQYMMNSLFVNNGFGIMSDIGLFAGVSQTDWSWAPLLADFDNDGLKDLMVTNGFRRDTKNNDWKNSLAELRKSKGNNYTPKDYFEHLQKAAINPVPNLIYKNKDGLSFEDSTEKWGFAKPSFSNGAAYGDFDQDGDLDIVINNFDQPAFVYRNNSREHDDTHFIKFKLTNGAISNTIMHSKINIYYGDQMQASDYTFTRGYQSYVEPLVHFGLGKQNKIDRVEILWNDGKRSIIKNPKIDQIHIIDKKKITSTPYIKEKVNGLFAEINNNYLHPGFKHQENTFDDFQKEILIPHRQSMLGPAIAVGDVNGDGLEDFYIGGAKDQSGTIYIQVEKGHFNEQKHSVFEQDKGHEDGGAKFIDIDGDNDLDLYVASGGGGDLEDQPALLQDRLYLNNGRGNFSRATGRLPKIESSTRTIAAIDWDEDGDIDIFVGGRTTPGKYPLPPSSYLLENNNGKFSDQTKKLASELEQIGMVTGAEWSDTDADGKMDLVLVGEWMPISVFKNTGDGFKNITTALQLENTTGWWSSLQKSDLDNDGDDDFIVGNIGLNNKFHPSEEKPLYIYANDFDNNGRIDIVLSKIYNNRKVPIRGKECSTAQMPFIADKFPTYQSFATASLEDIYEEDQLSAAVHYEAYNFASQYMENLGNGEFQLKELPREAQLAPINGIVIKDFDKDGNKDIVVAGNQKQTEVETPQYDSGKGLFLKGLGNGEFATSLQMEYSGLFLHRDVKQLALIHLGPEKRPAFLVANNNDVLELVVYRQ